MKRRKFIATTATAGIGIAALHGCKPAETPTPTISKNTLPRRWVWMRPDVEKSMDDHKRSFEKMVLAGFQAVLPQIYASNDTLFKHPTLPMKKPWLEAMIPIAKSFGLEVHAWMWCMPNNNPEIIEKHPDWFSYNRLNQPSHTHPAYVDYYKFMCPCHPEVREYVASLVRALSSIEDLDGVHLDYIRQPDVILAEALQPKYNIVQDKEYPQYDYPYSPNCRRRFKEETGIDPLDLGDEAPANDEWRDFRYRMVSELVNEHLVPEARKKNKKITAAVFPNWESVRQPWHKWDLDGFLPMLYNGFYNEDIDWIVEQVSAAKRRLNNDKPVFAGLYMPDMAGDKLSTAIAKLESSEANGFSIFSYNDVKENHWKFLQKKFKSS